LDLGLPLNKCRWKVRGKVWLTVLVVMVGIVLTQAILYGLQLLFGENALAVSLITFFVVLISVLAEVVARAECP
jgi:hypothetical protein